MGNFPPQLVQSPYLCDASHYQMYCSCPNVEFPLMSACGRSEVHRPTHQGQRICGWDRKGTFFFKGKSIQSAQLLYWHLIHIITDVIAEFASTGEIWLGQAQKTGFFTSCPVLATSCHTKCCLCFFQHNCLQRQPRNKVTPCLAWQMVKDNWVFQGQFSKGTTLSCWVGGWSEAFRQVCLTDPSLTDLLLFHIPCSKGWGIFLTQIPTIWYLHLLSHIHLPPELMEWVGTSGKKIIWPTADASLKRSVSLPGSCKGHLASHQLSLSTYIPRNSIPGECSDAEWLQQRKSAVVLHTQ